MAMSESLENQMFQWKRDEMAPWPIFSRFLDSIGDGSGTKSFIGNSSGSEARIVPSAGQVLVVQRLLVHIEDAGPFNADNYGGLAGALGTGHLIKIYRAGAAHTDLTDGVEIQANADWGKYCFDVTNQNFGAGNDFLQARWTFSKSGRPITLNGDNDDSLRVLLQDDFTGLVDHSFMVQGYDKSE
jgi:hypothetical protein